MSDRFQRYRAFCDSLKESLSIFEAWEAVQYGTASSGAFAAQVAQRLKGEAPTKALSTPAQKPEAAGKEEKVARTGNWGTVRDRTLEALQDGPKRCKEIVKAVIELSPEDQRPEGEVEKKNHYTTVNNGLRAMVKDQYVVREDREVDGKTAVFWSLTEKGRTYLAELGK